MMLSEINGAKVFGMSKSKVEELFHSAQTNYSDKTYTYYSVSEICLREMDRKGYTDSEFHKHMIPIHCGFECSGCGSKPLIGARYTCQDCSVHFCGACFKGRAHAHSPGHQFTTQDFPGTAATDAPAAPAIIEGSTIVVIGTGNDQLDGKLGLVTSGASPFWSVLMDGEADHEVALEAQHLFLHSQGQEVTDQAAETEPSAETGAPSSPPKSIDSSRFTLVRRPSFRELRQVEGQEALERFKSAPGAARKSSFLCKGTCGRMVEKKNQEYIREGQLVLCQGCMQKSQDSEKKTTCEECLQEFVYSQFFVDLGIDSLPTVCMKCKEADEWAIVSPLSPQP